MSHLETERTYDLPDPEVALPDLAGVLGVERAEPLDAVELEATYLDSARLDLLRRRVTLRRREGGDDQGWHLKLAAVGDTREELHAPLTGSVDDLPAALGDLVVGMTGGAPLVVVATLRTHRTRVRLHGADGLLGEVCDDLVTAGATAPGAVPTTRVWREWEVELASGPAPAAHPELLDDVEAALLDAGAVPAEVSSKLARALGGDVDLDALRVRGPRRVRPGRPAGRVLHAYLVEQVAALDAADLAARRGSPAAVHDLRVALRRLRTALATWRPLVDPEVGEPLRERMRALSGRLGDLRDAEVIWERLLGLLDAEPADLALGEARRMVSEQRTGTDRAGLAVVLRSEEHLSLLADLRALAADPPLTEAAEQAARDVVGRRLRKDVRRVLDRAATARACDPVHPDDLHEVRKAAKRLRYAAEAAEVVAGRDARRLRRAAKRVQRTLGEHHDTVMTRDALVRLAGRGSLHPGTGFTLGRLHAREEAAAARLEATWAAEVEALRRLTP